MAKKTQLVVRRGETLAVAAEEQAAAAKGGEPLALSGLAAAAMSAERAALAQASTYEQWAADATPADALLGRALLGLADQLRRVARQANKLRHEARDALDAIEAEAGKPG